MELDFAQLALAPLPSFASQIKGKAVAQLSSRVSEKVLLAKVFWEEERQHIVFVSLLAKIQGKRSRRAATPRNSTTFHF